MAVRRFIVYLEKKPNNKNCFVGLPYKLMNSAHQNVSIKTIIEISYTVKSNRIIRDNPSAPTVTSLPALEVRTCLQKAKW